MKKLRIAAIAILLIMAITCLSGCVVMTDVPSIKEGRFDLSVTYEINGEQKTYSGVYVCEYDGVLTTFLGSGVQWKGYMENGEETQIPILTTDEGTVYINLCVFPDFFMDDLYRVWDIEPNLYVIYCDSTPDEQHMSMDEADIAEFGVKLISYDYADPIKNTYKKELTLSSFEPSIN